MCWMEKIYAFFSAWRKRVHINITTYLFSFFSRNVRSTINKGDISDITYFFKDEQNKNILNSNVKVMLIDI